MELKDLCGKHIYKGVELSQFNGTEYVKFVLDDNLYIVTKNPCDGYRSYMNDVEKLPGEALGRQFMVPPIEVTISLDDNRDNKILNFIDIVNGKTFLSIGTKHWNDYYPICIFDYEPENIHLNEEDNPQFMASLYISEQEEKHREFKNDLKDDIEDILDSAYSAQKEIEYLIDKLEAMKEEMN